MADTVFVKSGLATDQVALWEVDERHPGGEVWVAGIDKKDAPAPSVEVAKTPLVMKYLGSGRLVEVGKISGETKQQAEAAKGAK